MSADRYVTQRGQENSVDGECRRNAQARESHSTMAV